MWRSRKARRPASRPALRRPQYGGRQELVTQGDFKLYGLPATSRIPTSARPTARAGRPRSAGAAGHGLPSVRDRGRRDRVVPLRGAGRAHDVRGCAPSGSPVMVGRPGVVQPWMLRAPREAMRAAGTGVLRGVERAPRSAAAGVPESRVPGPEPVSSAATLSGRDDHRVAAGRVLRRCPTRGRRAGALRTRRTGAASGPSVQRTYAAGPPAPMPSPSGSLDVRSGCGVSRSARRRAGRLGRPRTFGVTGAGMSPSGAVDLEVLAALRAQQVEHRLAVLGHERVQVHHPGHSARRAIGGAGDDHAAVAVPDQHDVAHVLEVKQAGELSMCTGQVGGAARCARSASPLSVARTRRGRRHAASPATCSSTNRRATRRGRARTSLSAQQTTRRGGGSTQDERGWSGERGAS